MPPTREQLIENIKALESQGAPQGDIQAYLDQFKGQQPEQPLIQKESTTPLSWRQVSTQAISNIPSSGIEFLGNIASAVLSPIQTVKGLGKIALGGIEKLVPGEQKDEPAFDALTGFFKERYGGISNLKSTLAKDPVGFLADISSILSGVGGALRGAGSTLGMVGKTAQVSGLARTGELASQIGKATSKIGEITDPLQIPLKTAGTIIPKSSLEERAVRLYQSALKPTKAVIQKYPNVIKTGLREGIVVGQEGLETVERNIDFLNTQIDSFIGGASKKGLSVSSDEVVKNLRELKEFFANTVTPKSDLEILAKLEKEFIAVHGKSIPVGKAQTLKKNTYAVLRKSYGQLKNADIEGQKQLARGIKEELVKQIPELSPLNARESELIGLERSLEDFVRRDANRQLISLGQLGGAAVGGVIKGKLTALIGALSLKFLENPEVKSRLAIILDKAAKGQIKKGGLGNSFGKSLTPLGRIPAINSNE